MESQDQPSDALSDLQQVIRRWNDVAEQMIATIKELTDESSADAALPSLIDGAQIYQRCYDAFFLSDLDPMQMAELYHQRVVSRMELEAQLRRLKFQRKHVFKHIRKVMKYLGPCDIDVSPNVD